MIANERLLQKPASKTPIVIDPLEPSSLYRNNLNELLQMEYKDVYLHPTLLKTIVSAIDHIVADHIRDIVVREEVQRVIEGALCICDDRSVLNLID